MNPTIPNCKLCGSIGTYYDKDGPRCNSHRIFYPNTSEKLAGYGAGYGSIQKANQLKEQTAAKSRFFYG